MPQPLLRLDVGQVVIVGGNRFVTVPPELAEAFRSGDRIVALETSGDLLHIPMDQFQLAESAVARAVEAFDGLAGVTDDQISHFFDEFAGRLADDDAMKPVLAANGDDVAAAAAAGRSTTRLVLTGEMRRDMIAGLRGWRDSPLRRDEPIGHVGHDGWSVEARRGPLGVVGFVFEGRPNVFADAAGVVRTGNTVVMRIGSDAFATATAIMECCVRPAIGAAGLPEGTVGLLASRQRSAGWALFAQDRLALAVARGSGRAVEQLGGVARQSGTVVSLHGTGGAWLVAGAHADAQRFSSSVRHSLDRKVCNTLNVCCIPQSRLDLVPVFLEAIDRAGELRGAVSRLHVERGSAAHVPADWFHRTMRIDRADGPHDEPQASMIDADQLGVEWEWEHSPEVSFVVVSDMTHAVELHNRLGPRFVASIISDDAGERDEFYRTVDAPFVGDGFTRWVDGQYALDTPELGLSNWQFGRLMARGAILSGDSVYTVRHRASVSDPDLHR